MKKNIILQHLILSTMLLLANFATAQTTKFYGTTGSTEVLNFIAPISTGYVSAGTIANSSTQKTDIWFLKTDLVGNSTTNYFWGHPEFDNITGFTPLSSGGYAVLGYTFDAPSGHDSGFLLRFDDNFNPIIGSEYTFSANEIPQGLIEINGSLYAGVVNNVSSSSKIYKINSSTLQVQAVHNSTLNLKTVKAAHNNSAVIAVYNDKIEQLSLNLATTNWTYIPTNPNIRAFCTKNAAEYALLTNDGSDFVTVSAQGAELLVETSTLNIFFFGDMAINNAGEAVVVSPLSGENTHYIPNTGMLTALPLPFNSFIASAVLIKNNKWIVAGTGTEAGDNFGILAQMTTPTATDWSKTFGKQAFGDNEACYAAQQTVDGGYLLAVQTSVAGRDNEVTTFIKTDAQGNEQSQTVTNFPASAVYTWDLSPTNDGGFIALATTNEGMLLIKMNSTGAIEWQQNHTTITSSIFGGIRQLPNGTYVAGVRAAINGSSTRPYYITFDINGNLIQSFLISNQSGEYFYDINKTNDGNLVLAGRKRNTILSPWVTKISTAGAIIWEYVATETGRFTSVKALSDGSFIAAGYSQNINDNTYSPIIVKLNANGTEVWKRLLGYSYYLWWGYDIAPYPNGTGFILSSLRENTENISSRELLLTKLDNNGNTTHEEQLGYATGIISYMVGVNTNNEVYASGLMFHNGSRDAFLHFTPLNTTVSTTNKPAFIAQPLVVIQNPVQKEIRFKLETEGNSNLSVILYDVLGRVIRYKNIVKNEPAEIYTINTDGLSDGFYSLSVKENDKNYTQKIIIESE